MESIYAVFVIGLGCLLVSGLVQASDVPDCQGDAKVGSVCLRKVDELHLIQFAVASIAVDCKRKKIEKKYQKGKLDA